VSRVFDEEAILRTWLAPFERVEPGSALVLGPGDDAAAYAPAAGKLIVATTDALVDGVHFERARFRPSDIGHKALAVNLSDLAAMGARPSCFLVSLGLPADLKAKELRGIAEGMAALAKQAKLPIAGGNVSAASQLSLHLTLFGEVSPARMLRRDGARPGELLFVTGSLGDAALGLASLQARATAALSKLRPTALERSQLRPLPRCAFGQALAALGGVGACMDLSDGLATDLPRLLKASGVKARVSLSALPRSTAAEKALREVKDPFAVQLAGGEDYELLFSAPVKKRAALMALAKAQGLRLSEIGEIESMARPGPALQLVDPSGGLRKGALQGYQHHALNFNSNSGYAVRRKETRE